MTAEELAAKLVEYDAQYATCQDGCPFERLCRVVRIMRHDDSDPCVDFVALLRLINEADLP